MSYYRNGLAYTHNRRGTPARPAGPALRGRAGAPRRDGPLPRAERRESPVDPVSRQPRHVADVPGRRDEGLRPPHRRGAPTTSRSPSARSWSPSSRRCRRTASAWRRPSGVAAWSARPPPTPDAPWSFTTGCGPARATTGSRPPAPTRPSASSTGRWRPSACAAALGFRRSEAMRDDPALEPLRRRDDFRLLLMDLLYPDSPFGR